MTKLIKFILAILIQVAIILGIILLKITILSGGSEVLLKIAPVDPTDPFRGDYITFRYDISDVPYYHFYDSQSPKIGDTIFISLARYGKYWEISNASTSEPTSGEIFLKAKVTSVGIDSGRDTTVPLDRPFETKPIYDQPIEVTYGLEEYFIPEGKGRNFDFTSKEIAAKVIIDDNGNAVLNQVYIDDQPWP